MNQDDLVKVWFETIGNHLVTSLQYELTLLLLNAEHRHGIFEDLSLPRIGGDSKGYELGGRAEFDRSRMRVLRGEY